jgi:hypothetical protein
MFQKLFTQRFKTKQLFFIAVVGALMAGAYLSLSHAAAPAFYVDCVSGADTNDGNSISSAWRTLSAINKVQQVAGNAVYFKRGCTWDGILNIRSNGVAGSPVAYTAYGTGSPPTFKNTAGGTFGHAIQVYGDYNIIDGFLVRDSGDAGIDINPGADHNIVKNSEITAAGFGISARGQSNLLTKNYVHDLHLVVNTPKAVNSTDDYGATCFIIKAPQNEISYNRGINCRSPSEDFGTDGGFVEIWENGNETYVHNNYAEGTNGFMEAGSSGTGTANNMRVSYNIVNNVFGGMCLHDFGQYKIAIDNFRFENNTYIKTGPEGYRVFDCLSAPAKTTLVVRNNIFYSNIQIGITGQAYTHSNNIYFLTNMINGSGVGYVLDGTEVVANPMFKDISKADFNLLATSPAIGKGVNLGYTQDYQDNKVPSGTLPDAGALEYQQTASLTADLNKDGLVNVQDLSILLSAFKTNSTAADINLDGQVDITDLSILLSVYGK